MSLEDFKQYIRTMAPEERHAWQYIVKRIDEIRLNAGYNIGLGKKVNLGGN